MRSFLVGWRYLDSRTCPQPSHLISRRRRDRPDTHHLSLASALARITSRLPCHHIASRAGDLASKPAALTISSIVGASNVVLRDAEVAIARQVLRERQSFLRSMTACARAWVHASRCIARTCSSGGRVPIDHQAIGYRSNRPGRVRTTWWNREPIVCTRNVCVLQHSGNVVA
jgi:hypothetical protein